MARSVIAQSYCGAGEFLGPIYFNLILSAVAYLLIKKTGNWSWMDRFWSLMPMVHALHFWYYPQQCLSQKSSSRRTMMLALVVMWGVRLTHTMYRKGVYSPGKEDPRLAEIRKRSSPLARQLWIILFICLFQPMLSLLMASAISYTTKSSINPQDIILFIFGLEFIILEGVADQQQHNYQTEKKKYQSCQEEDIPQIYRIGFVTKGLWGYSRHPNYFAQMSFWWVIYLYSFIDYGLSLVILGVVTYTIFFYPSAKSGETISLKKYPMYALYKQNVSQFIPLPNRFQHALQNQL